MQYPASSAAFECYRQQPLGLALDQRHQATALIPHELSANAQRILLSLQMTLEIEPMLQTFADAVCETVAVDGISYEFPELDIVLRYGRQLRHVCSYRLGLEGQTLGELVFRRARRFRHEEIAELEKLLCSLVYPLRNALLYRRALHSARSDPLTGLHNRAALDHSLSREIGLAQRHDHPLSLLIIDIDKFKAVNDQHGHAAGDRLIAHVANQIVANIRETDLAFRYGGEEFIVLLSATSKARALVVGERIRESIAASRCTLEDGTVLNATVSIGVEALQAQDGPASLFERADQALYRAKHSGRNRVCSA